MIAQLKSADQIANELGLSTNTVNGYLAEARSRLSAPTSRHAALLLIEHERMTPQNLGDENSRVEPRPPVRTEFDLPERQVRPNSVHEVSMLQWDPSDPAEAEPRQSLFRVGNRANGLGWTERILFILVAAVLIVILTLAVAALGDTILRLGRSLRA